MVLLEEGEWAIDLGLGYAFARGGVVDAGLDIPELVIVTGFVLEVDKAFRTCYRHF